MKQQVKKRSKINSKILKMWHNRILAKHTLTYEFYRYLFDSCIDKYIIIFNRERFRIDARCEFLM